MYLAIDLGTGSVKVGIVGATGQILAHASAPYRVHSPQPGWGEIQPAQWLRATTRAILSLPANLRDTVRAISFSGQMHGVVLTGAKGQALCPAILWLDTRTQAILHQYPPGTLTETGNPPATGMMAISLAWLAQNLPTPLWQNSAYALSPKDWLRLQLTGHLATDASDASGTLLADQAGLWSKTQCNTLDALAKKLKAQPDFLPPVLPSFAAVGPLLKKWAQRWALPENTTVVLGAADTACAALGAGLTQAGQVQLSTGTGMQLIQITDAAPLPHPGLNAFRCADTNLQPMWYRMAAMLNGGSCLEWTRRLLGLSWARAYEKAFAPGMDAQIEQAAYATPWLHGERSPWMNPHLHASFLNLRATDHPGTLMRAMFEAVAFSVRQGWDALFQDQTPPRQIRFAGGGALYAPWAQLLADVLQTELLCVEASHAALLGASQLAATGIKKDTMALYRTADKSQNKKIFSPTNHKNILERYQRFKDICTQITLPAEHVKKQR